MNQQTYSAPWGRTLRWMSVLSAALLVAVVVPTLLATPPDWLRLLALLPLVILLGAALFIIRDYTLDARELLIRRLLWTTHVPLADLQSASFQPEAMRGSFRWFGNGGLFSITGWYRNWELGNYRAFVTELKNTVVLRFTNKTIVVSPDKPEQFVAEISHYQSQIRN